MNEYEETQAGRQLSDDDEILDGDEGPAYVVADDPPVFVFDTPDGNARLATPEELRGNVMNALTLYRSGESWVYDDARFGRVAEPLILGASEILDQIIVFDLGTHTRHPVSVIFSSRPFPRAHMGKLMGEEMGGHWYSIEGHEAWLCPALLDYFETAPPELYVRVTGKAASQIIPISDAEAYDPSDPKHPDFHSTHADLWDARDRG